MRRIRSAKHRKFINSLPCARCWASPPNECAHISMGNLRGTALKAGDDCAVPACNRCHRASHTRGEASFWGDIDRVNALARKLYEYTGQREICMVMIMTYQRGF